MLHFFVTPFWIVYAHIFVSLYVFLDNLLCYEMATVSWEIQMCSVATGLLPLGSVWLTSNCCLFQHQIISDFYITV